MAQIPRCCGPGVGRQLQLLLGTSICQGNGPRKSKKDKKKKQTNKQKKQMWQNVTTIFQHMSMHGNSQSKIKICREN